ncbi:PDGLE domain-containing protein [Chloroflexota bacterium]
MKMKMKWWHIGLVVCLLVAAFSPLASSSPDGLERVAEDEGFISLAQDTPFQLIADYAFPGIENEAVATILAGLIGTLILFGVVYGMAWLVKSRRGEPVK